MNILEAAATAETSWSTTMIIVACIAAVCFFLYLALR